MDKFVERMGLHQAGTFEIDIRKIDISNIWIGERTELDEEFFEEYDSILYIKGKKTLMIKLEYPDHFQCFHDLKEDIDAPLEGNCLSWPRPAKYHLCPEEPITNYTQEKSGKGYSLEEILNLLPEEIKNKWNKSPDSFSKKMTRDN